MLEDQVTKQTREFKIEIEKRFLRSGQKYVFPYECDSCSDSSLRSLENATIYDLNKKRNPSLVRVSSKSIEKSTKTNLVLLKLLSNNKKPFNSNSKSGEQSKNRSITRTNASFYQPTMVTTRNDQPKQLSRNTTQRMRTEGSVLREATNMMISPKVIKSPTYSKYIQIDSYLNSTKSRLTVKSSQNKSFQFNKSFIN